MTTLTITRDQLDDVREGDRLVAIDDLALTAQHVVTGGPRRLWPNGPVAIPLEHAGPTDAYLYPDSMIARSITVEREEPEAEPAPKLEAQVKEPTPVRVVAAAPGLFLRERERKTLRRNRHYEATLRLLDDGKGGAVDLRTRIESVNYANLPLQHSRTAGALEAFYGWVEKVGDYTWRLTPAGRRVLAVLDQRKQGQE